MKYSLVIADDEPRIIELICQLGHFEELEIEVVDTCVTGREAYESIQRNCPDIVLSDIKMPEFDGIELIKKVREIQSPGPLFILISGYRHFEYARSAVSLNVMDYLLKPIEEKQLNDTLEKVCRRIDQLRIQKTDRETISALREEQKQKTMDRFWKICKGDSSAEEKLCLASEELCNKQFDTGFQPGCYQVLCLCSDLNAILGQADACNRVGIYIEEAFHSMAYVCYHTSYKRTIIVLNYREDNKKRVGEAVTVLYYSIRDLGERYGKFRLNIGVSSVSDQISQLPSLFKEAVAAEWGRLVLTRNGILEHYQVANLPGFHADRILLKEEEAAIKDCIRYLRKEELANLFGKLYQRAGTVNNFYPGDMAEIFSSMGQSLAECIAEEEKKTRFAENYYYAYLNSRNYAEVIRNIYIVLENYIDEEQKRLKEKKGKPITIAVGFMKENYSRQLSLDEVAAAANVSGKYLSRIFPDEMGMGFNEYLTQIRMEASEKLLAETNMSIKEIALAVGYLDEKYYSKLFKKLKGIKPTEYRRIYN